eukprot:Ihof_evm1s892 gene=Ihof_evmTU1s892
MNHQGYLCGHTDSVLSLTTCPTNPDLLASSSEDATARIWDLSSGRCKRGIKPADKTPVTSIAWGASSDIVYLSTEKTVHMFDLRSQDMILSQSARQYQYNKDEINSIAISQGANYLAAADDTGDVHIVDLSTNKKYKTLSRLHTNICSSVAFRPGRRWECLTGGFDSMIHVWDYSKGRPIQSIDMSEIKAPGAEPGINPPFVYSLAVSGGRCAVGLGNCSAAVFADSSVSGTKKGSNKVDRSYFLESVLYGGHHAGVASVCFVPNHINENQPMASSRVVSGGNDRSLCLWDLNAKPDDSVIGGNIDGTKPANENEDSGYVGLVSHQLVHKVDHGKK